MTRFHLETAVVGPEIDGYTDASDTALIDLFSLAHTLQPSHVYVAHHLRCLRASNRELEIRIFLPKAKEEWEAREEFIVDIAGGCNSSWA